jgi:DNA polymerase-3 subunit epsilon
MLTLLLDTETTGLLKNSYDFMAQPGIVQIAAVKLDSNLETVDRMNLLVNPEKSKWDEGAERVHGISPEHVQHAPTFFDVGSLLAQFAFGCERFAGYNVKFDKDVIWWQLIRYGLEKNFPWPLRDVDIMLLAGERMEVQGKRGCKHPKLEEAYRFFIGKDMLKAHDAMFDVDATVEVWRAL